jgi:dihydrofolate synthase / folylpolyglutamate synthase
VDNQARLERLLGARAAFGVQLGLERIQALLERLADPQRRYRSIHVVGTNGKTSTSLFTAAILTAHDLRTGAYISPHVTGFAERVRVDDAPVDAELLADAVRRVERHAPAVEAALGQDLTQFEVLTAAAFAALAASACDAAVIEAGLGGRHDATNVIDAPVVVLTNVALDHTKQLGDTRDLIAAEKLAVVKPAATLVAGEVDAQLATAIHRHAPQAGRVVAYRPGVVAGDLPPLAARGAFQRVNASLALAAAEAFLSQAFDRPAALAAVARLVIPGRLELIGQAPLTLIDGAHNPHGARALARELPQVTRRRRPLVAVLAILADKDVDGVLDALAGTIDRAIATQATSPRALAAAALADALRARGVDTQVEADPALALAVARRLAGDEGAVIVAGSLALLTDITHSQVEAR